MDVDPDHGLTPNPDVAVPVSQDDINLAVETLRDLAGWHVWPIRSDTVTVDTAGDSVIFLPTLRLLDVTSVEVDGTPVPLDSIEWSESGMIRFKQRPRRGFRRVTATIRHGFESTPLTAVAMHMASRSKQPGTNMAVGGISVGAPGAMTPQSSEWRLLDRYKLGPMP
ncbi:hypothetical protein [Corynebacterium lipophiloflavum]|uniref:Uncharacterized protein n=1 Tax=Corynebacterium lipophiloflavum (strain ATCC 700352 / DSM 44291 / CCUG 37336 / JCM 10383 / DMMZ 1944) TaxID=525263 RepID=C0XU10_CORLD|nr:hypothetical protein [Corynebacterium lipophiloflavum]EEI16272.1 hypothetical protein HMPREF0298_1930 [Corynebacterium lipophiloflavum DSM 44291]